MKLVDLMMSLGMNRTSATMSIPMMWFTPAITDRYSSSTIEIVKTLQRHLRLPATGQIDAPLSSAMLACCGNAWQTLAWVKIYRMVAAGATQGATMSYQQPMGGIFDFATDALASATEFVQEVADNIPEPWCSTAHPNGTCRPIAGVCKPMTLAAAELYKRLQNQLNRCAAAKGWARIAVDARPGSDTIDLANKVFGAHYSSCDEVCANAWSLARQASVEADRGGAPATVSSPEPKAPASTGAAGGGVNNPPNLKSAGFGTIDQLMGFAMSPIGIALIVGAAAWNFGVFNSKPKKKAKAKKKPRRPVRRRTPKRRTTITHY